VIRVQDERHIEGFLGNIARFRAGHHIQEVACIGEFVPWLQWLFAATEPVVCGQNRRNLGSNAASFPERRIEILWVRVGFEFCRREHRCRRSERSHRIFVGCCKVGKRTQNSVVDAPFRSHRVTKVGEFCLCWQCPFPEEVEHFLVARFPSKFLDIVAAIDELSRVTVYVAEL